MRKLLQEEIDALNAIYDRRPPAAKARVIAALLRDGLIVRRGDVFQLTPEGRLLLVPDKDAHATRMR